MATVQCPHCGVSLDGEATDGDEIECPSCENTFTFKAVRKFAVSQNRPVTIERTSKRFKACTLVGWLFLLAAGGTFALAWNAESIAALVVGAVLFAIGAAFGLYAKIGAWWTNG